MTVARGSPRRPTSSATLRSAPTEEPKPAVGDSGNLTNWPNELFFVNSLFVLLFFVGLQRVKSAYRAELHNQERSPRSRSGRTLMQAAVAKQEEEKDEKEEKEKDGRKSVTVGSASSEADLVGCQLKHGGFLPKKADNQF